MVKQLYNLSQLNELAADSPEFVDSMVETFLEHTPQQLDELLAAYRQGDMTAMGGVAHKIKPNIDLFGISEIGPDIRTVEAKGKSGINDDELKQCVQRVEEYLKISFQQLRER